MTQQTKDEVMVTQYLRPDGRKREMLAPVGENYVEKAKGMVLSAEVLPYGKVALYARLKTDPEEEELIDFAQNGPGPRSPVAVLRSLIDELHRRRTK